MIQSGVYKIVNKVNGKVYVGSAVNLKQRKYVHLSALRRGAHHSQHLQKAFNKYGEESFNFIVLEIVPEQSKLIEREQYFMDLYHATDIKYGYNICLHAGNTIGIKASGETKRKMSQARRGQNNSFYGRHHSEETKQKLRITRAKYCGINHPLYGKMMPEERKNKISQSLEGRFRGSDSPNYGKPKSEEIRNKIREDHLGKYTGGDNPHAKAVINLDTGEIFGSQIEAAQFYNLNKISICNVCKGRAKTAGGYHWMYYDDYLKMAT